MLSDTWRERWRLFGVIYLSSGRILTTVVRLEEKGGFGARVEKDEQD